MKKILYFVLFLTLSFPALSAVSVKGKIIDANTQSPLDFVNVTVFKSGNSFPVANVVSNASGDFTLPTVNNGKYTLRISYVGYNTYNQELLIAEKSLNIGTVQLEGNSKNLAAVEVIGQGSQMHFDVDKKVFSVDQNIAAAGGSASDVLKNIPSVTVDNQGNVSLRKDGNVKVWINGKASGLTADNRAQILQQLPAESIESVEIMTNPSAKFNPEGSAGIINIVMKKNRKAGYYGSMSAGITYPDGGKLGKNFGTSINYSSSKVDAYLNLGYRAMSFNGGGKTVRTNYSGKDTTMLNQTNDMLTAFSGLFMRAGIDYHLDTKNTISLSGFGMDGSGNQAINNHYTLRNNVFSSSTLLQDYTQNNTGTGTRPSLNMNMDYHHDFNKNGTNINANLSYSNHNRTGNTTYEKSDSINKSLSSITQNTENKNTELELKVDYTNKLTKDSKLEAGWQSTLSNRLSKSSGINNLSMLTNPDFIPAYFDGFNYNEQIHAAYLTYGNRIDKLTFQLGLRGEYFAKQFADTTLSSNATIKSVQNYNADPIVHIFPSFYLSYSLPNNNELQFNYSNRVNRPRGQQINPYRNYSDPNNISFGNPYLLPQYSSSMELNYIKTWDAQTLSASMYYHNTDNVIENVRYVHNGVMENTYLNISKSQNTGLELISKNRLFRTLGLTSTLNMYYSKLDSTSFINPYNQPNSIKGSSSFSWSANIMANFMLSKTFSGQITAEYESPQIIAQGTENAKYSIDFGVRQTLLDRKLSLSLNVRDLLNSDRNRTTTSGNGFFQNSTSYFHGRMVGLTATYNFGNLKPKQTDMKKKAGAGEMNMEMGESN